MLLGSPTYTKKRKYHDFHIINRNERLVFILNHFVVSIIYCHRSVVGGKGILYGRHAWNMAFKMRTAVAFSAANGSESFTSISFGAWCLYRPFHMLLRFRYRTTRLLLAFTLFVMANEAAGRNPIMYTRHIFRALFILKIFFHWLHQSLNVKKM